MSRPFHRLLAALLCCLALCGCGSAPAGSTSSFSEAAEPAASSEATVPEVLTNAQRAAAMTAEMSREEKVGQLFFARAPEKNGAEDVRAYHLGGYILFGRDTEGKTANDLIQTIRSYQAAAEIPLLIGVDEEGGTVVRVSSNPHLRSARFKSPRQLYNAGGLTALIEDCREKDGLLKALGFNVNLGPVADVSTHSGDFIYPRALGQDAEVTAQYTAALTAVMAEDGMGSVLKHFPGYGGNADTHTGVAIDRRDLEVFEAQDFLPFSAGLQSGGPSTAVLVSHNIVTCLDETLPASLSPALHEKLRQLMEASGGADRVVMTDDLVMEAVRSYAEGGSAAVLAIAAGNDLLIASDYARQIPEVLSALEEGVLDEALVDAACTRVLLWKLELGLLY